MAVVEEKCYNWRPRIFEIKDFEQITYMTKNLYGDVDISHTGYINWQYLNNPNGKAIIWLAENTESGELAGQYVVLPIKIKIYNDIFMASLSVNTLTALKYQKRGIFTSLAEKTYQTCIDHNIVMTYGFPNQKSYHGLKKLHFTDIGSLTLFIRPVNFAALAKSITGLKSISKMAKYLQLPYNAFFKPEKISCKIKEIYCFDKSFDVFWDSVKNKYPIMVVRTSEYLNWRFVKIPKRKYRIFAAYNQNGVMTGYIVLRRFILNQLVCGGIVDFILRDNAITAGNALINKAIEVYKKEEVDLIGFLGVEHAEETKIINNNGFVKCPERFQPQPFPLLVKRHFDNIININNIFNIKNFYLVMGDYDVI